MRYLLLLFIVTALLATLWLAGLYAFTPYATMRAELETANQQGWAAMAPLPMPRLPLLPVQLLRETPITAPTDYFLLMRGRTLPAWVRPPFHLAYEHDNLLMYRLTPAAHAPSPDTTAEQ